MRPMKFGVGQPVRRLEDQRLVTGHGSYIDDLQPEKVLHGFVLRSPYAHARFEITDAEAARAIKGVKLVLTAAEVAHLGDIPCQAALPNGDGTKTPVKDIPVLCKAEVKHVGDAVAFIVADSIQLAKDAAEALVIDWQVLPAVSETVAALASNAAQVWSDVKGNVSFDTTMGDKAAVDAIFASAFKTVKLTIDNNRLITNYMETRGVLAEYDAPSKELTLTLTSQGVHGVRDTLAGTVFKMKPEKLRVMTPDVGGGFGTKSFAYREYALAGEAARLLKRPVKWFADRSDHFVSCAHGRDNVTIAEAALDRNGKFLAMRFDWMGNIGAYMSQYGPYIHYLGATMLTGVYATKSIFARVRGVFTNTVPVDAYRGAGRPEAAYTLERLVDYAAREMGMKPDVIRRRNFIKPSEMPYKTLVGDRTYDVGDFDGHMTQAVKVSDWDGFGKRLAESKKAGKLRGIGLATYIECTAWGNGEAVKMHVDEDGGVTLYSGTQSNGQGHATAYAQFASQVLDITPDMVRVVQGDTKAVATGHGTGGSRSIPVGGVSAYVSATNLSEKLKKLAADKLEAGTADLELSAGAVRVVGTDRKVTFAELAKQSGQEAVTAEGEFTPPNATYPNGTHVAELEIDPATGVVEIQRYTICDDFGTTVNPMLLAGQVHGGVVQGIGQALMERTVYDSDGQLISASFMDYAMPRADSVPGFHFETRNVPSTTNPLGIKGAGEAGSIGSCPAVINAVVDALDRARGVRHVNMPATPEVLWKLINTAAA